mgnify:CR=1 FL=1
MEGVYFFGKKEEVEDTLRTTFYTRYGHYEFLDMPFWNLVS